MALKNNKFIKEIRLNLENISPLHIGGENGEVLIEKENSLVYIPGTTIAGAFRAYLKGVSYENIDQLFGKDKISKVFFYDSYQKLNAMEVRPAVKINSEYGVEENKFERDFIAQGHNFSVKIEIFAEDEKSFKDFERAIYTAIAAMNNGDITLGSYKSTGAGQFTVLSLKESNIDLTTKLGLFDYLKSNNKFIDRKIDDINKLAFESKDITFLLKGDLETPILIKGEDVMDEKRADGENMKNAKGDYIIPGTSLKGILRAEAERILSYLNKEELEEKIFGSKGNNKNKKNSKIKCFDSIIEEPKVAKYNRIKIDKFTGGVVNGAKMDDDVVQGKVRLESKLSLGDENLEKKATALIALIFRDIAMGNLSLGGGFSIGRGRVKGEQLTIKKGNDLIYSYNFKNSKEEVNKLENCFKALREEL